MARTIALQPSPVTIVAHSLGCITTVHLPAEAAACTQGALLVAPANPERRAIVIGPITRLELLPSEDSQQADPLIDAQIPSQQYRDMGLREGDMMVLAPRHARVFVEAGEGI